MVSFTILQDRFLSRHHETESIDQYLICVGIFIGDMIPRPEYKWLGVHSACSKQPVVMNWLANHHGHLVELGDCFEEALMDLLNFRYAIVILWVVARTFSPCVWILILSIGIFL
jgi:hypothetical protein